MTLQDYEDEIKQMCVEAGTYAPYFDRIIKETAELLVYKDDAERQYYDLGGTPTLIHTNKAGFENVSKNPQLTIILDIKTTLLSYWRDLGLTPKGLRSLGETIQKEENNSFEQLLSSLGV